jgi:hypothetical protein
MNCKSPYHEIRRRRGLSVGNFGNIIKIFLDEEEWEIVKI